MNRPSLGLGLACLLVSGPAFARSPEVRPLSEKQQRLLSKEYERSVHDYEDRFRSTHEERRIAEKERLRRERLERERIEARAPRIVDPAKVRQPKPPPEPGIFRFKWSKGKGKHSKRRRS